MNLLIIANIFSFIGAALLAYSTFSRRKDRMLYIQAGDCVANALACFFSGSYTGATTNLVSFVRNIFSVKIKYKRTVAGIFAVIILALGIIFNTKGIIGLLPVIASIEYTLIMGFTKNAQGLRFALLVNVCLWFVHDFFMHLYPALVSEALVFVVCVYNIIMEIRRKKSGETSDIQN